MAVTPPSPCVPLHGDRVPAVVWALITSNLLVYTALATGAWVDTALLDCRLATPWTLLIGAVWQELTDVWPWLDLLRLLCSIAAISVLGARWDVFAPCDTRGASRTSRSALPGQGRPPPDPSRAWPSCCKPGYRC